MRILISGASGFIGSALAQFLQGNGHAIFSYSRTPDQPHLDPFDVVIHLAGEPLTLGRWSQAKQERILLSRTQGTEQLCRALLHSPPKLFLSASAVGYYGNRGEELLTENSPPGTGFLAHVCREWEKASQPLAKKGVRVVHTRFGMVLGPHGGALQKMLLPYKLGLGGKLGSGKQWMSWVARDDLIRAIDLIIANEDLEGPVNVVSPHPVRQEEFSKILAKLLHRPSFLTLPAPLLKGALGLMAEEMLLASARVEPTKLLSFRFPFRHPDLNNALHYALQ